MDRMGWGRRQTGRQTPGKDGPHPQGEKSSGPVRGEACGQQQSRKHADSAGRPCPYFSLLSSERSVRSSNSAYGPLPRPGGACPGLALPALRVCRQASRPPGSPSTLLSGTPSPPSARAGSPASGPHVSVLCCLMRVQRSSQRSHGKGTQVRPLHMCSVRVLPTTDGLPGMQF